MFTLKIENVRGEVFELTHDTRNYYVVGVTGLTPPQTPVNRSTGAGDGSYYNSTKTGERNVVITLQLTGDVELNRQKLYRVFPMKQPCTIYFKNARRDVKISGYVEIPPDGDLFVQHEQMQVSIICTRPYFEGVETIFTELSTLTSLFEFPFAIETPIPFSEVTEFPRATVTNSGDVECGVTLSIGIRGNVSGIVISDTTSGKYFGLNYQFIAGDEITINTHYGNKNVSLLRNGQTSNLLNYMTYGSAWFQIPIGDSVFTFAADSGAEYIDIAFATVTLYGGV